MKINKAWLLLLAIILLSNFSYKGPTVIPVDLKQSKLIWTGFYLFNFGEHRGTVELSKGEFLVENQTLTGGHFDINMKTIKNLDMPAEDGGKDLTKHLMSQDFFSVDQFPLARFEITKIEPVKDVRSGVVNYEITGDLMIKETKNSLTFPAWIIVSEKSVEAKARFKFDRTKWNIRYSSGKFFDDVGDGAISDAIAIELDLVAKR
jgi:polyisoprenoid-binding protein YceI